MSKELKCVLATSIALGLFGLLITLKTYFQLNDMVVSEQGAVYAYDQLKKAIRALLLFGLGPLSLFLCIQSGLVWKLSRKTVSKSSHPSP